MSRDGALGFEPSETTLYATEGAEDAQIGTPFSRNVIVR